MQKKIQKLYEHIINEIQIATAKEQVRTAAGLDGGWETGKRLAYMNVANRLVDLGCRVKPESETASE